MAEYGDENGDGCNEGMEPDGNGGCVNWTGVIIAGVVGGGGILFICGILFWLHLIGRRQEENVNIPQQQQRQLQRQLQQQQQQLQQLQRQQQRQLQQQASRFNQQVKFVFECLKALNLKILEIRTLNYI